MVRVWTPIEIHNLYADLYESCFGKPQDESAPPLVLVHEDDDGVVKGFVAGRKINSNTFYYSFAGTVEGHSMASSRRHWNSVYDFLRKSGIEWCETCVENTNTVAQRVILGQGWVPFGIRVMKDKILVQYYKEL